MSRPIFCGNFEYDARQSELERLFRKYGKVDRVDMKSGFAFIYMEDERDAEDAIRGLDHIEFGRKGRPLRVEWTKQERGVRRPSGGGSRKSSNSRPSKTLFVINFDPYNTRTRDLEKHFERYGKIVNVRIRRNFAFVQYDSEEDAIRALEATNLSKLMDRVISVEFAIRDDDEKRGGYSPERGRDRSPERRGRDRGHSPSPYRRERGSPDYGRARSPSPRRRDRGSPDYGRRRSPTPPRKERSVPDYDRPRSRSPYRNERASPYNGRGPSRSPYREDRASPEQILERSRSPYERPRGSVDRSRDYSRSPPRKERVSADRLRSPSPYAKERGSDHGRSPYQSPDRRELPSRNRDERSVSPYPNHRNGTEDALDRSPDARPARRTSPEYDGADSPDRFRSSRSPIAAERSQTP